MIDMNKVSLYVLAMVAVIIAICVVGKYDYNEAVLQGMSNGTYEALREKLGDVSESVLVDTYMAERKYWDSLGMLK